MRGANTAAPPKAFFVLLVLELIGQVEVALQHANHQLGEVVHQAAVGRAEPGRGVDWGGGGFRGWGGGFRMHAALGGGEVLGCMLDWGGEVLGCMLDWGRGGGRMQSEALHRDGVLGG